MRRSSTTESQPLASLSILPHSKLQKQRRKLISPRSPSVAFRPSTNSPGMPGDPFAIPTIHVSSPTPPGLPTSSFPGNILSKIPGNSSTEASPTLTMPVEPKARAKAKMDDDEITILPVIDQTSGAGPSSLKRVKNRNKSSEQVMPIRSTIRQFSFARMPSFWGWDSTSGTPS